MGKAAPTIIRVSGRRVGWWVGGSVERVLEQLEKLNMLDIRDRRPLCIYRLSLNPRKVWESERRLVGNGLWERSKATPAASNRNPCHAHCFVLVWFMFLLAIFLFVSRFLPEYLILSCDHGRKYGHELMRDTNNTDKTTRATKITTAAPTTETATATALSLIHI